MRRFRGSVALLALVAIAVLVLRPAGLNALGAPYGAHFSPEVQMTQAEGSPHCTLLADCETVSISNAGLDLGQTSALLVLAGIVLLVTVRKGPTPRSWAALVPNPPPLFALS